MNRRDRAALKARRLAVASAGSYARCPNQHTRVQHSDGHDALGKYLDVYCNEPGCSAPHIRIRDLGRDAGLQIRRLS